MTIRYEVLVKDADKELKLRLNEEYCCYGAIGQKFRYTEQVDAGYKTVRRFSYGRFQGIKLHLDHDTPYGQGTTHGDRIMYQQMMRELNMYEWLGINYGSHSNAGKWFVQEMNDFGDVINFTFTKDCPMFLVVAVTGIWRMFANAKSMHLVYRALTRKGIHSVAALAGALQVDGSNFGIGSDLETHIFRVCHYQTHMPWGHRCMDVRAVARLMQLTHEDFKELPGMYEEQKESMILNYDGRDNWFFGTLLEGLPGSTRSIAVPGMKYLSVDNWQSTVCTPDDNTSTYHTKEVKGSKLIEWCQTLDKEARLLKGYDLQADRAQTRAYINEAKARAKKLPSPPIPGSYINHNFTRLIR